MRNPGLTNCSVSSAGNNQEDIKGIYMDTLLDRHWHHLPEDEVLDLLESDRENGLDIFEAEHRRKRFGPKDRKSVV